MNRRHFLLSLGTGIAGAASFPAQASTEPSTNNPDAVGMLVDTTECIGCRKCEFACASVNALTDRPPEAYEDTSVFEHSRRMTDDAFTVVNKYPPASGSDIPVFIKLQCMHCLKPACASACIVGALHRQDNGAVTYDPWKCIGCRYCMVACPFQVPAYQYDNAFTPKVRKCSFCFERVTNEGKMPACAEICPPMCLTFAKRTKLIELARQKMAANPKKYFPHIYGEHEVGGTSWMYLAGRPVTELGLLEVGDKPVPALTETIQHNVFKMGLPPLLLFGLLGAAMKTFAKPETDEAGDES